MNFKLFSKKLLSITLSVVLLVSCLVFSVPEAAAENEYKESYDVSFSFELTDGVSHTDFINDAYIRLYYLNENGYGEEEDSVSFSFKENYSSYLDDANMNTVKQVVFENVPGFPKAIEIYLKNSNRYAVISDGCGYHIYDMTVNGSTVWTGDMYVQTQGAQRQVVLSYSGYWTRDTGNESGKQSECYCAISAEDTNREIHLVNNWVNKFPYADSIVFTDSAENIWAESLTVLNDNTVFSPAHMPVCLDQYGVLLPNAKITHKISEYNGQSYFPLSASAEDIKIDTATGEVSANEGGFTAAGNSRHILKTKLRFDFGEIYKTDENGNPIVGEDDKYVPDHTVYIASEEFETAIVYPEKTVSWRFYTNSEDEQGGNYSSLSSTVLFGDGVSDADFPGEEANRSYYTSLLHYNSGKFASCDRVTDDISLNMGDYVSAAHNIKNYAQIEGDENNHKFACDCGYGTLQAHTWDEGQVTKAATCKEEGILSYTCSLCSASKESVIPKAKKHIWDDGIVTTEPTCTTHGVKTYTCTICGETDERIISALDHIITLKTFYDENGVPAGVYFSCDRNCGAGYWQAAYNEETGKYYVANKTPFASPEEAVSGTEAAVSKLEFNSFEDANTGHNYENRDASLRYDNMTVPVTQAMRFMASVKVPGGVSWAMGSENNAIEDVGFVYSLTSIVGDDKEALKLGKDNVYSISVANRNESAGVYDGSNWNGVSKHETAGGTFLTFNIVINVSYSNWSKPFSARAYTKYNYNGFEYLVYDNDYSSRSVEYIANQVVNNPEESQAARDYCQKVILDNIYL